MASTELRPYSARKVHELNDEVKQQIRDQIEHGDGDVYRLATEFDCAPIQVAGIKAAMHKISAQGPKTITSSQEIDDLADPQRFLNHLLSSSRARAKEEGMEFNIDDPPDFVAKLYQSQGGLCAVSRIKFNLTRFPDALVKHPYAPSIDRVLSSGGYTQGNVRLVCVAVNFGLGQWGDEVYLTLARSAVDHERQREKDEAATPVHAVVDDERRGTVDVGKVRATLEERLDAAEKLLPLLPDSEQEKQRHRIAGFKAALTKRLLAVRAASGTMNSDSH